MSTPAATAAAGFAGRPCHFPAVSEATRTAAAKPAVRLLHAPGGIAAPFVFKRGYMGSIIPHADIVAKSWRLAQARRDAAVAGGFAKRLWVPGEEAKGCAGELIVRDYFEALAKAGVAVELSELLAAVPDHRPDVVVDGLALDVKTTLGPEAAAELGGRVGGDRLFVVSEAQLDDYEASGVAGVLFVFIESPGIAHLAGASLGRCREWQRRAPARAGLSHWHARPVAAAGLPVRTLH